MQDSNIPTTVQEQHVDPYWQAVKEHVPAAGDYYSDRNPHFNSRSIFQLIERTVDGTGYALWTIRVVMGPRDDQTISESTLKEYYRPLIGDFGKTLHYARMVVAGNTEKVTAELLSQEPQASADTEALMASGSKMQVAALLDESERLQNMLTEIQLTADIIIENKKAELQEGVRKMNEVLAQVGKKIENLVKIITVLNLYTGNTVELEQIADGDPADPDEPLHLRQRILYMDEELCVHLDREADYSDLSLFMDWLREPGNRDIVAPEQRCIVALKPKHRRFEYRSGDPYYDAERNMWNRHTYLLLRNGEKLYLSDSEDLELFDSAFPHSDFEEEYRRKMADPQLCRKHESTRYRTTKFMVYLQGIVDGQTDVLGPMATHPNLMKGEGVVLVRDDENLVGTGRLPWQEFVKQKNESIRIGTRVVFVPGRTFHENGRAKRYDGDFMKYYTYDFSKPEGPGAGIYSMEPYNEVVNYVLGEPVYAETPTLVFRYLPGDEVWYRNEYGYSDTRKRTRRVAWKPAMDHVINYDAVTADELRAYMEDRTMRPDFREMMPLLKRTLLQKEEEERDERAFKELVANTIRGKSGKEVPAESLDEAVAWWKEKVIYTRALRSDDAKAFRMIMKHIESQTL